MTHTLSTARSRCGLGGGSDSEAKAALGLLNCCTKTASSVGTMAGVRLKSDSKGASSPRMVKNKWVATHRWCGEGSCVGADDSCSWSSAACSHGASTPWESSGVAHAPQFCAQHVNCCGKKQARANNVNQVRTGHPYNDAGQLSSRPPIGQVRIVNANSHLPKALQCRDLCELIASAQAMRDSRRNANTLQLGKCFHLGKSCQFGCGKPAGLQSIDVTQLGLDQCPLSLQ